MKILNDTIEVRTEEETGIYDITDRLQRWLSSQHVLDGQMLVFVRHTTTGLAINEFEEQLLADIREHIAKLVPRDAPYAHNDLIKRNAPPGEPKNAHAHLIAMMLHTSEVIPVIDGGLGLGTWQSVLFFELDGPQNRTVFIQFTGHST